MNRAQQVVTVVGFFLLFQISIDVYAVSYEEFLQRAVDESPNGQTTQEQLKEFEQQFQSFEGAAIPRKDFSTATKTPILQKPLSFADDSLNLVKGMETPAEVAKRIMKMFPAPKQALASPINLNFDLDLLDSPLKEIVQQLLNQIRLINATEFETTLNQAQAFAVAIDKTFIPQLQNMSAAAVKYTVLQSTSDSKVVIAVGDRGKNFYQADAHNNFLLIIDFGGDDTYQGSVAASKPPLSAGIVIDLSGNDRYLDENGDLSQGAAVNGVGMLVDVQGDDVYVGSKRAQGYGGSNGIGILWDQAGNDRYVSYQYSQGSAQEGFGLLLDNQGDDVYYIVNNPAEPSAQSAGFSDAFSQGVGIGDYGFGFLIDLNGDDVYSATVIAQGAGWNQGLGILHDEKGNDLYMGVHYVMGASAHRGFGAFFDLSGKDRYSILDGQGAGASSDTGIASFIDGGVGDDVYILKGESGGAGTNNSFAAFIDEGGNDSYYGSSMGRSDIYTGSGYEYRGLNLGIFIDITGIDFYSDGGNHDRQDVNGACIKTESGSEEAKRHPTEINGLFCDW